MLVTIDGDVGLSVRLADNLAAIGRCDFDVEQARVDVSCTVEHAAPGRLLVSREKLATMVPLGADLVLLVMTGGQEPAGIRIGGCGFLALLHQHEIDVQVATNVTFACLATLIT